MAELPAPERVRASTAAAITGLSLRTVQSMASRREIPGSAKLGGAWTFDLAKLRRWIAQREAEGCQETSTSGATLGGAGFRLPDATIGEAYARAIGLRQSAASRRGSKKSTAPRSSGMRA